MLIWNNEVTLRLLHCNGTTKNFDHFDLNIFIISGNVNHSFISVPSLFLLQRIFFVVICFDAGLLDRVELIV